MDDFERFFFFIIWFWKKEKYLEFFLTDTLFLHILLFQNILSIFFLFWEKNLRYFSRGGVEPLPPPLADADAKNNFFYVLP